jgi:hypothetical protein
MPSVDGVGRYFPLCALGMFEGEVAPPELDEQAEWFAAVESVLLAALDGEGSYPALLAGLAALPPVRLLPVLPEERGPVSAAFAALRQGAEEDPWDRCTCWWVPSPDGIRPPLTLLRRGLPSPDEYASMVAPGADPDAGDHARPSPWQVLGEAT